MRARQCLVQIWDGLEEVADDEYEDDADEDAGKVDLLLVNWTLGKRNAISPLLAYSHMYASVKVKDAQK